MININNILEAIKNIKQKADKKIDKTRIKISEVRLLKVKKLKSLTKFKNLTKAKKSDLIKTKELKFIKAIFVKITFFIFKIKLIFI